MLNHHGNSSFHEIRKKNVSFGNWATERKGSDFMRPKHVFADDGGNIYAVTFDGELLWYKDVNRNGTPTYLTNGQSL